MCRRPAPHLSEVAGHFDVVPRVVVKLSVDGFHDGLEGPGPQIDDEGHGTVLQGQVDVIGRLARVQDEPVTLPRLEGQSDLVVTALDGVLREVVAEIFRAAERGHVFLPCWWTDKETEREQRENSLHG